MLGVPAHGGMSAGHKQATLDRLHVLSMRMQTYAFVVGHFARTSQRGAHTFQQNTVKAVATNARKATKLQIEEEEAVASREEV